MKKKNIFKCQRGASAVEFAIVLPLLLLFVFGIIEFGILFYDKAVITNASREGARAAILYRTTVGEDAAPCYLSEGAVKQVVLDYCSDKLINFNSSEDNFETRASAPATSGSPAAVYRTVRVRLDYNFLVLPNILAGFFGGSFGESIRLVGETTMRLEGDDEPPTIVCP